MAPGKLLPQEPSKKEALTALICGFAEALPELLEDAHVSKEQVREAWEEYCQSQGQATAGFAQALYSLRLWRVLHPIGVNRFQLADRLDGDFTKRTPESDNGALQGLLPPGLGMAFPSPVPSYPLPQSCKRLLSSELPTVHAMHAEVNRLLANAEHVIPCPPTTSTLEYKLYQHDLLWVEEVSMGWDMALYKQEVSERLTSTGFLHEIPVPGLAEKRPSILKGDEVLLISKQGRFLGYVHQVQREKIKVSFHKSFPNKPPFEVHFHCSRVPLRTMHRAIDDITVELFLEEPVVRAEAAPHPKLNEVQRCFLSTISAKQRRGEPALPYLLWGPPGTGKTTTLVHSILALVRQQREAHILVTAPSNPAADLLCERLVALGVKAAEMLRLVALSRDRSQMKKELWPFTRQDTTGNFSVPSLDELQRYRIIVCTCVTVSYLRSNLSEHDMWGWFTHVFVDEAAQAMEAEVLVPVTMLAEHGRLCLAGDHKQLGPVIRSPVAVAHGLQLSLMERLAQFLTVDHSRVFALLNTYRAHPSILRLYNVTVYAGMLKCCSPKSSYDLERFSGCPKDGAGGHPVIFHHVEGEESRSSDSPSWQNIQEVEAVKSYLLKLKEAGIRPEDIGIISPYYKQCIRLRQICRSLAFQDVDTVDNSIEVGTTEAFQGREKKVILISTVRSRATDQLGSDLRFSLGFVSNYKRTNVALSRAKSLLIVVGNLSLLSSDATWNRVIRFVKDMGGLRGGEVTLQRAVYGESSEWGVCPTEPATPAADGDGDGVVDQEWRDHY